LPKCVTRKKKITMMSSLSPKAHRSERFDEAAKGYKRTFRIAIAMSALLSKADICTVQEACPLWAKNGHQFTGSAPPPLPRASLTADFVVPLPFHASPFSSSNAKQLG